MTRIPYITEDQLDDDQRRIWDALIASRGSASALVNDEGGMVGPFNSMLYSPNIGRRISALGGAIRFQSSLPANILEVVIMTVGAHWKSNFEFWAHSRLGREAGVSDEVIDAIRDGVEPAFDDVNEAAAFKMVRSLLTTGRVDEPSYRAVADFLGDKATVELTSTIGYYCLISLTLNTFAVELPADVDAIWPY